MQQLRPFSRSAVACVFLFNGLASLAGCAAAGDSLTDPRTEPPVESPPPAQPPAPQPKELTWDVVARGVPKIVAADYIDLARIGKISRFRSNAGHDYADDFETCRSMKHYFVPADFSEAATIPIYAPVTGEVTRTAREWAGIQVHIRSDSIPALTFILFHVNLSTGIEQGDTVHAGQAIGTHIGSMTSSDITIGVSTTTGRRLVSYFDAMPDSVWTRYQARGIETRQELIITAGERDADPLTCSGEGFTTAGTLSTWVELK